MAAGQSRWPLVAPNEQLYRAVLTDMQWDAKENRPSSALFTGSVFSVDIASLSNPRTTRARFNAVLHLVEFNCGEAALIGFETRHEPDDKAPDNLAHAHVYFLSHDTLTKGKRKAAARKLVDLCSVVPEDRRSAIVTFAHFIVMLIMKVIQWFR